MSEFLTIILSVSLAFLAHHFAELFLSQKGQKDIRLVVRGRQIHHSFWGVMFIVLGMIFTTGHFLLAFVGYGIGNIWQHKRAHNRLGERGFVFISKVK